ncbi:two-component system, LuxR family, sensor kinase FixL [Pararobbsia alpina]|uniref:trifunctional serine/threonine-protein kinase/ATP-binding protein/sensor histidine kinase n=1 Tax=Pararobbsia alpina TaxID=621374 RepID=UPI0039A75251
MQEDFDYVLEPLHEAADFILYRGMEARSLKRILVLMAAAERPSRESVFRLEHEWSLARVLDSAWAVQPLALTHIKGRPALVFKDPGGEPLDRLIEKHHGCPVDLADFLRIAVALAAALGETHRRGLIHKDIKPANVLADGTGSVWLTGFGVASWLPRERALPLAPEIIAGTLAYMSPEQTGRMNRSIDSRSDLYSLGVTLYELLTGTLPFHGADPMEWVHCHIARQAVPPSERDPVIPPAVSSVIVKLLAKTAEDRYQTAVGLEHDLQRCLSQWETQARIEPFVLGAHDTPDRLWIPEKLYGRESEIDALLKAFGRVVDQGRPELVLVSGYSGVGKSSLVNELHKPLVPPRGYFASGKFDQYKRDIPYATLASAFRGLIRPILAKREDEVDRWCVAIREALGPNGQLMVDLVPELELIIGKQSPVPELAAQDAQSRFQVVFRRFVGVFTREHPLALFLDDLQWLDAATLDWIADLLTHPEVGHLMLIGAYRDNEVDATHPLMRTIGAIRRAGAAVSEVVLEPLRHNDLEQLISDALRCDRARVSSLAMLIETKTHGNPFFAIQFLSAIAEEGLLAFDYGAGQWRWDLDRIRAMAHTENVVDLMVGKLHRLPVETQIALQQLACLGNNAEFGMLAIVYQESSELIHRHLWDAVRAGFISRTQDAYRFVHDRVQEAAYSLMPEAQRAEAHLRIGMLMVSHTRADALEDGIFEITSQLNRGAHLMTLVAERERLAELNLMAARRAKMSTAYASALAYLRTARDLVTDAAWDQRYELIFSIELLLAECEMQTTASFKAQRRLSVLAERANTAHDLAVVTRLRLTLYDLIGHSDRGVEVFLAYLQGLGEVWSPHPSDEDVSREYNQIAALLGTRTIGELVTLPLLTDPDLLDVLGVLTEVVMLAMYTDANLLALVLCRMVTLSLRHGNCDASCFAYVSLGMLAGPHLGDYAAGFEFGRLGYDLVEERGLHRYQARVYLRFASHIAPWRTHIKGGRALLRRAFDVANRIGDLTFASYSFNNLNTNLLAAGDHLADVQKEVERGFHFATNMRFPRSAVVIEGQLVLVRTLRGLTKQFGSFDDEHFDEREFESQVTTNPSLLLPEGQYWIRKLQARFFAEDHAGAIDAARKAEPILWTLRSFFDTAEYHFYGALARAGAFDTAIGLDRLEHREALSGHHAQLAIWAQHCPDNFENRVALARAEIARIDGHDMEAMPLYEQAIRSAHAHGFIHNEAVANELAGKFYLSRGIETAGHAYLRSARNGYARWGATGKVEHLDSRYPHLREERAPAWIAGGAALAGQLDVGTVVKASQALSGEIMLPALIERLMRIAMEHAGAERGLLILIRNGGTYIEAEATTGTGKIAVTIRQQAVTSSDLLQSALHYVIRTRESVMMDDASADAAYATDDYVQHNRSRSVLCVPIVNQSRLSGALYLENNLASRVFTSGRVAILQMLASQAAISLERTRAEDALRQASIDLARINRVTTMGELAASLAHEINQPLTGAITNAIACLRWLDRDAPDLVEVRSAVKSIVSDGERAAQIMRRIRTQFEKGALKREVLDINEIIRETVELLLGEAARTHTSVRVELAPDLPQVVGDRVQLQQVAMNLIVNGIEAMKEVDGVRHLSIRTRVQDGGRILVSVSDTGAGIPPEITGQIFEAFFTTKPSGTGMGLRICRSIVESHGGDMRAVNGGGPGATLEFTLPVPGADRDA